MVFTCYNTYCPKGGIEKSAVAISLSIALLRSWDYSHVEILSVLKEHKFIESFNDHL